MLRLSASLILLFTGFPLLVSHAVMCVRAQELPFDMGVPLPGVTGYSEAIPKPEAVIGHRIGNRHTIPSEVVDYFRAVDAVSDRVVLQAHGRTYEGRLLIHAIVTSPANHAKLEEIRQANLRLSDSPGDVPDAALADMPAIVWMGYSIHGNEASGTEAALLLLYHLAAGSGPAVEEVLDRTVIILDPLFNPDGRDRFTDWVNRNRGMVPTSDPQDREHNEPWPTGRTNHYWFDLNRDWLPAQHPESQGRLEVFHNWRPQVLTDYHEMGSDATFFFQPGVPSRVNPNTPARNQELTSRMAEYHARALDQIGSLYFTEEQYDDFYYGKGSTYPDVNGAIGILFEQASSRALERETVDGVLPYAFTIRNQFVASLSTLESIVELREELLRHQRDFYAEGSRIAAENPVKGYVIGLEPDPARAHALAGLLRRHRIALYELAQDITVDGQAFRRGSAFIIPMDQPQTRLLRGIMEPVTVFEDSIFYDISTWTLPLAFGLKYAELRQPVGSYLGTSLPDSIRVVGQRVGGEASYAYVLPWGSYYAPRALYRLQSAGAHPRLMMRPFSTSVDGQPITFRRGSIVVPVMKNGGNPERIHEAVRSIVTEDGVTVYALHSGLTPSGPELGGLTSVVLERPRVALITGPGVNSSNAGEVWHLLSERMRMPVSLLDAENVSGADLRRYNTIVLAGGSYGRLPSGILADWVRGGGHLIGIESGAEWAVRQGLANLTRKEMNLDSIFARLPYDQVGNARDAQDIAGAIFRVRADTTHPVVYGYDAEIPVFRTSNTFYEPAKQPGTNVAVYTDEPLLSGYVSKERMMQAPGSASIYAAREGRGAVTLFFDNPNFRAFWYGTNGLFLNALFFGGAY